MNKITLFDIEYEKYTQSSILFYVEMNSYVTVNNTSFENITGKRGIIIRSDPTLDFYENSFTNCFFQNGLITLYQRYLMSGHIHLYNNHFFNITSNYGSIVNAIEVYESFKDLAHFINSTFENISASYYGGIIYSESRNLNESIIFENCEFINCHAKIGDISYSVDKNSEPFISNIDELKKIPSALATNPTNLVLNDNSMNYISLYSGQKIPDGISCKINKYIINK
ncbi:hypothetical protein PIROE2DRAFT_14263 [Piromyces sp. E2]|nr:hypothetical protein PIROE2DRAFT_14263 [Piromyces sp. E2]|eukprot:OUM60072.1 hypothetical protein PIROE2DRAFT_14263 [Piromyces sp. E2]